LFGFISNHSDLTDHQLEYFFKVLILIQTEISPANNLCPPLKEYAQNCVSQSNQKRARNERSMFFENLLLNNSDMPNEVQGSILDYYEITKKNGLENVDGYRTLNITILAKLKPSVKFNG